MMRHFLTALFFFFICWVIFLADNNMNSVFFDWVKIHPYGDKFGHLFLFGILTLFLNVSLRYKSMSILGFPIMIGSIAVLLFALIEEFSQYYFLNRSLDIFDALADVLGIFLFTVVSIIWRDREKGREL